MVTLYGPEPTYKIDKDLIEKVQRKATKLVPSIRHLSYEERFQHLGLPSLKYRRFHDDMIMTYNLLHGHLDSDESLFFTRSWNATRGHMYKLFKLSAVKGHMEIFSQQVVSEWNSLPCDTVEANSVINIDSHTILWVHSYNWNTADTLHSIAKYISWFMH